MATWLFEFDLGAGYVNKTSLVIQETLERRMDIHRDLSATTNEVTFQVGPDASFVNALMAGGADVPLKITKDGTRWFTGYVQRIPETSLRANLQNMSLKAYDPSILLKRKLTADYKKWASTVSVIVGELLTLGGVTAQNLGTISKTIDAASFTARSVTYFDAIGKILADFGYVLWFDETGTARTFLLYPSSAVSTKTYQTGQTGNIDDELKVARKLTRYGGSRVSYFRHDTRSKLTVFSDPTAASTLNKCNIDLSAYANGYPDRSGSEDVYCEYAVEENRVKRELIATNSVTFDIQGTGVSVVQQVDYGLRAAVKVTGGTLTRLDIVAGSAILKGAKVIKESIISAVSEDLEAYEAEYLTADADADFLVSGRRAYWENSGVSFTFKTSDTVSLGAVVTIVDSSSLGYNLAALVAGYSEDDLGFRRVRCEALVAYSAKAVTTTGQAIPAPNLPLFFGLLYPPISKAFAHWSYDNLPATAANNTPIPDVSGNARSGGLHKIAGTDGGGAWANNLVRSGMGVRSGGGNSSTSNAFANLGAYTSYPDATGQFAVSHWFEIPADYDATTTEQGVIGHNAELTSSALIGGDTTGHGWQLTFDGPTRNIRIRWGIPGVAAHGQGVTAVSVGLHHVIFDYRSDGPELWFDGVLVAKRPTSEFHGDMIGTLSGLSALTTPIRVGLFLGGSTYRQFRGYHDETSFWPPLADAEKLGLYYIVPRTSPDITAPSVPTGLSVTQLSSGALRVAFNASTDTESGVALYRVYRRETSTTNESVIADVNGAGSGPFTLDDTSPNVGKSYQYAVAAVDVAGNESAKTSWSSSLASVISDAPATATGLTASAVIGVVSVVWTAQTDAIAYRLEKSTDSGSTWLATGGWPRTVGANKFDDTIPAGTASSSLSTWRYRVKAISKDGVLSAAYSSVASVTVATAWTYTPSAPTITGSIAKRTATLTIGKQANLADPDGWDVQISRDGSNWYAPNLQAATDADNWQGGALNSALTVYDTMVTIGYLPVTLSGGLPLAVGEVYYLRARARGVSAGAGAWSSATGALTSYPNLYGDLAKDAVRQGQVDLSNWLNQQPIQVGLTTHVSFDDIGAANPIKDSSDVGTHVMTLVSGTVSGVGVSGKAMRLNGSSKSGRIDSYSLKGSSGWAISLWVQRTGDPNAAWPSLVENSTGDLTSGTAGRGFAIFGGTSTVGSTIVSPRFNVAGTLRNVGTFSLTNNLWYHVVFNYTNGAQELWVNGALVGSQTYADGDMPFPGTYFWAGKNSLAAAFYQGYLDELRFYDHPLPEADVRYLYANPGGPVPAMFGAGRIVAGSISTTELAAAAVTADKISVTNLDVDGAANILRLNAELVYSAATALVGSATGTRLLSFGSASGKYAYNYFDLTAGQFRVGDATSYIYYDGAGGLEMRLTTFKVSSLSTTVKGPMKVFTTGTLESPTNVLTLSADATRGTVSHTARLMLNVPGAASSVYVGDDATGKTQLILSTSADTNGYAAIQAQKVAGTTVGDLVLQLSGGNVGIGLNNPTYKLEVSGTGRVSGVFQPEAGVKTLDSAWSDASGKVAQLPALFGNAILLTSGTSFVAPRTGLYLLLLAGGGAGGTAGGTAANGGGGGGGGGSGEHRVLTRFLIAGVTYTYAIGGGGAAGSNGSDTTWGAAGEIVALGGKVGTAASGNVAGFGGQYSGFGTYIGACGAIGIPGNGNSGNLAGVNCTETDTRLPGNTNTGMWSPSGAQRTGGNAGSCGQANPAASNSGYDGTTAWGGGGGMGASGAIAGVSASNGGSGSGSFPGTVGRGGIGYGAGGGGGAGGGKTSAAAGAGGAGAQGCIMIQYLGW